MGDSEVERALRLAGVERETLVSDATRVPPKEQNTAAHLHPRDAKLFDHVYGQGWLLTLRDVREEYVREEPPAAWADGRASQQRVHAACLAATLRLESAAGAFQETVSVAEAKHVDRATAVHLACCSLVEKGGRHLAKRFAHSIDPAVLGRIDRAAKAARGAA